MTIRQHAVVWKCLHFVLLLFVVSVCPGPGFAQSSSGNLRGQAADPSGAMVANATVSATDASGKTTTGKTDGQGAYEFRGLPSGAYTVTAVAKGFGPARQQAEVVAGRTTQLNIAFGIPPIARAPWS